jgi:hypothetical protein
MKKGITVERHTDTSFVALELTVSHLSEWLNRSAPSIHAIRSNRITVAIVDITSDLFGSLVFNEFSFKSPGVSVEDVTPCSLDVLFPRDFVLA